MQQHPWIAQIIDAAPTLSGSPKQVAWAADIRRRAAIDLLSVVAPMDRRDPEAPSGFAPRTNVPEARAIEQFTALLHRPELAHAKAWINAETAGNGGFALLRASAASLGGAK